MKYYAVYKDKIYLTWEECKSAIFGKKGCKYKSFKKLEDADYFLKYGKCLLKQNENPNELEIYTDGSFSSKTQKGGSGIYFPTQPDWNLSILYPYNNPTSQKAEIFAIIKAVEILNVNLVPIEKEVKIYTDSSYCVNAYYAWIPRWKKTGWMTTEKNPVKNRDLLERMYELLISRNVKLNKIAGHDHQVGNVEADKLAKKYVFD